MAQRMPAIDPQQVIARNLADAEQALAHGRYLDPPERSALHYYSTVLALAPDNSAAQAGLDAIAQRFIDDARVLLADRRIAEAGVAMEKARRVRPDHVGLTPLDEQLRAELRRLVADTQPAENTPAGATAPQAPIERAAQTVPAMPPASTRPNRQASLPAAGETVRAPSQVPITPPANTTRSNPTVNPAAVNDGNRLNRESRPDPATATSAPAAAPASASTPPAVPTPQPASIQPAAAVAGSAMALPRRTVKVVQPVYPQNAVMRGLEGWVDVKMQINAEGDVLRPQVVHTEGGRVFNRPALQAVQQWKYEPRPGAAPEDLQVRIEFKLAQ
jgi:TonB family protein